MEGPAEEGERHGFGLRDSRGLEKPGVNAIITEEGLLLNPPGIFNRLHTRYEGPDPRFSTFSPLFSSQRSCSRKALPKFPPRQLHLGRRSLPAEKSGDFCLLAVKAQQNPRSCHVFGPPNNAPEEPRQRWTRGDRNPTEIGARSDDGRARPGGENPKFPAGSSPQPPIPQTQPPEPTLKKTPHPPHSLIFHSRQKKFKQNPKNPLGFNLHLPRPEAPFFPRRGLTTPLRL